MQKILKEFKFIKYYLILFFVFLKVSNLNAEIYDEIKVTGNDRLSIETIVMFSGLKTDIELNKDDLNDSIKKLYKTNYFENIRIIKK